MNRMNPEVLAFSQKIQRDLCSDTFMARFHAAADDHQSDILRACVNGIHLNAEQLSSEVTKVAEDVDTYGPNGDDMNIKWSMHWILAIESQLTTIKGVLKSLTSAADAFKAQENRDEFLESIRQKSESADQS